MRRYPRAVLGAVFAITLLYTALGYPDGPIFISLAIAFVNVVLHGRWTLALASLAAGYPLFLWLGPAFGNNPAPTLGEALGTAAWLLVLTGAAAVILTRRLNELAVKRILEAVER